MWPALKAMLHSVCDQPTADDVHAQFDRTLDCVTEKLPATADHLDGARADILAFNGARTTSGPKSGRTTPTRD